MSEPTFVDEAVHTAALNRLRDGSGAPELYDLLSAQIYGLALRLCSTPDSAASVCKDVFAYVCRNHAEYDATRATVAQWVNRLTHRFAVLACGDEESSRRHAGDTLQCPELTTNQRHDLVAAYFGGLTYHEIARQNGAEPSQVCDSLRSALRVSLTPAQG